jgi:hypothetical protein
MEEKGNHAEGEVGEGRSREVENALKTQEGRHWASSWRGRDGRKGVCLERDGKKVNVCGDRDDGRFQTCSAVVHTMPGEPDGPGTVWQKSISFTEPSPFHSSLTPFARLIQNTSCGVLFSRLSVPPYSYHALCRDTYTVSNGQFSELKVIICIFRLRLCAMDDSFLASKMYIKSQHFQGLPIWISSILRREVKIT